MKLGLIVLGWSLGLVAVYAAKPGISTLQVAEKVIDKRLTIVDLGKYPGMLLLHGMGEMARVHPEKKEEWLRRTVELLQKYHTKEIKGGGSFICYEAGGTGAAMLHYWKVANVLGEQVDSAARRMVQTQKRSTDGLMIPHWAKENQVFIDMAFPVTPFLLHTGLAFDRPDHVNLAVDETLELFRILEDKETGLVHQGRGFNGANEISDDNWSRGNGWGAFALSLLVRDLPAQHPRRDHVVRLAQSFYAAVLKHQDANGMWHQEMTDKTSYVETSGSGLLLYGLGIMIECGLLGPQHKQDIERGLRSYLAYIGSDGSVSRACKGCLCPGKGTKEEYTNQEWLDNDPHAFGPAALAFSQAFKLGIVRVDPGIAGNSFNKRRTQNEPDGNDSLPRGLVDAGNAPRMESGDALPLVKIERDIAYGVHERQKLDLAMPGSPTPTPLIIWVHGGGWEAGCKGPNHFNGWVSRGYAVASINYRYSKHAVFPAQIQDVKAAVRHLRANAKTYHLDPDHFGAAGWSAGGHLIALLGTSGGVKALEGDGDNLDTSSAVQAVCDIHGPTDLLKFSLPGPPNVVTRLLGGDTGAKKDLAIMANPITYIDRADPPVLILHGDQDKAVPLSQSEVFRDALNAAGVEHEMIVISGAGHDSKVFNQATAKKLAAFFDEHLKKR